MRFRDTERNRYRNESRPDYDNRYDTYENRYGRNEPYGRRNEYGSYGNLGGYNVAGSERDYYASPWRGESRYDRYDRERDRGEDRNWLERTGDRIRDAWNDMTGHDRDEYDRDYERSNHYRGTDYGRRDYGYTGSTGRYGYGREQNNYGDRDYGYTSRYQSPSSRYDRDLYGPGRIRSHWSDNDRY